MRGAFDRCLEKMQYNVFQKYVETLPKCIHRFGLQSEAGGEGQRGFDSCARVKVVCTAVAHCRTVDSLTQARLLLLLVSIIIFGDRLVFGIIVVSSLVPWAS